MTNHTPGPWELSGQLVVGAPEPLPNPKVKPRGKVVASIYWNYDGDRRAPEPRIQWAEAEANARLIAAAPELLSVLAEFVLDIESAYPDLDDLSDDWPDLHTTFAQARAAIAKAKGGEA